MTFLLPGFASSVIQTARDHGDGFVSLRVWLAMGVCRQPRSASSTDSCSRLLPY